MTLNSLMITVCSSEDKVVTDEGASTVMSSSGLHWGHIQQLVLWSNLPVYDFTPKCWKHEKKRELKLVNNTLAGWRKTVRLSSLPFSPRHVRAWKSRNFCRARIMTAGDSTCCLCVLIQCLICFILSSGHNLLAMPLCKWSCHWSCD